MSSQKRFVAHGITGGWKIWNRRTKKYWGRKYRIFPEDLLKELNDQKRGDVLNKLEHKYQVMK